MAKEADFKDVEKIRPMLPNEGPPLPKLSGVTWKSLGVDLGSFSSSSPSNPMEMTKAIPEMPTEVETITDILFNALMSIRGAQGVIRTFKGLGSPEGLFGKQK